MAFSSSTLVEDSSLAEDISSPMIRSWSAPIRSSASSGFPVTSRWPLFSSAGSLSDFPFSDFEDILLCSVELELEEESESFLFRKPEISYKIRKIQTYHFSFWFNKNELTNFSLVCLALRMNIWLIYEIAIIYLSAKKVQQSVFQ